MEKPFFSISHSTLVPPRNTPAAFVYMHTFAKRQKKKKMFREKLQLRQSSFTFGFRFKTILIINLYENRFLVLLKQKLSALEIRSNTLS